MKLLSPSRSIGLRSAALVMAVTNGPQLCFDLTAFRQAPRLFRLVRCRKGPPRTLGDLFQPKHKDRALVERAEAFCLGLRRVEA
jgi:hypothetical protein